MEKPVAGERTSPGKGSLLRRLAAILLPFLIGFGGWTGWRLHLHHEGLGHLREVLTRLESEGKGAKPADFVAGTEPLMPPERSQAFDILLRTVGVSGKGGAGDGNLEALVSFVCAQGTPLSDVERRVLDENEPGSGEILNEVPVPQPLRTAAARIADWTLEQDDPRPGLEALGHLVTYSLRPTSDQGRAGAAAFVRYERDHAWLRLIRDGRVTREQAAVWMAEDPWNERDALAASLRGWRLVGGGRWAERLLADDGALLPAGFTLRGPVEPEFLARWLEVHAETEDVLRDGGIPLSMEQYRERLGLEVDEDPGPLEWAVRAHPAPWVWWAHRFRLRARLARIAARVLLLREDYGTLPPDTASLREWMGADAALLDADPDTPATLYITWPGHFRLVADPKTRPLSHGPMRAQSADDVGPVKLTSDEVLIAVE